MIYKRAIFHALISADTYAVVPVTPPPGHVCIGLEFGSTRVNTNSRTFVHAPLSRNDQARFAPAFKPEVAAGTYSTQGQPGPAFAHTLNPNYAPLQFPFPVLVRAGDTLKWWFYAIAGTNTCDAIVYMLYAPESEVSDGW